MASEVGNFLPTCACRAADGKGAKQRGGEGESECKEGMGKGPMMNY